MVSLSGEGHQSKVKDICSILAKVIRSLGLVGEVRFM